MSATTIEAVAGPDPEVRPARHVYPAALKLRVLAELDAADSKAERGEILRREGLYSSLVSEWRKQRERGALEAMRARRPGPKGDPVRAENARLRGRVEELEQRLVTAEELIVAQGKVSALLQQHSRKSAEPR
jgi:transposase